MRKTYLTFMIAIIAISLIGCAKDTSKRDLRGDIQQIVKDVYAPKSMEQFRESYNNAVNSGLMTKEAADSFYIRHGEDLTSDDLKRSCYVDVMYSESDNNSEGKEHYLAKLQLHGAYGEKVNADIFFYVTEENIINKILVANIDAGE